MNRIEKLNTALYEEFDAPDDRERGFSVDMYEDYEQAMIEIVSVSDGFCSARHFTSDIEYERICFPPSIVPFLAPGDVFLVDIGLVDDEWHVIFSSPCYEETYYEH